ncbi:glycosyltransferase 61 family protein [Curtobacterium sp. MCLR17_036]|uniref:glycosyltransferase family 61 protein n=1 Tax=Curtobacterium sp. MCLR17_036 TaxID=2175620 RepID=UPI0011B3A6E4|nr:glycosyltransferase 61 family protein [Curtobacterium sp. MCLR17_036]WIE66324.1 glycosyltransferase 61 family protein [Curtobacterium sp. MCLR17_036]
MFGAVSRRNRRNRRRDDNGSDRLDAVIAELQELRRPVVLIAGSGSVQELPRWRRAFEYRLHVMTEGELSDFEGVTAVRTQNNNEMAAHLTSIGPVAAVIDELSSTIPEQLQRWQRLFFHVAAGGAFLGLEIPTPTSWEAAVSALGSRRISPREITELQRTAAAGVVSGGYVITGKTREHLVKVKDEETLDLLPSRLGANNVRLLGSRPAGSVTTALQVHSYGSSSEPRLPATRATYPELTLREFTGRSELRAGMLAVNTSTVLPSSFKHPWRAHSTELRNVNDRIAVLRQDAEEPVPLEGAFYDVTSADPGDPAHFFTESIPKLWGWREAKERDPSLRAFYRTPSAGWQADTEKALLDAFGIRGEDVHWEHRAVAVETFVSASQGWQNGGSHFAHPVNRELWKQLRSALVRADPSSPARLFVTRGATTETPGPRNAEDVERFFGDHGFTVVDVDAITVAERARLFGNATVVAGFAGGGLYNMAFAEHLERVIVLSHEANTGRNEHLFASMIADEIHYFWSKPDVEQPEDRFSGAAYNSAWDFDFASNRGDLERIVG